MPRRQARDCSAQDKSLTGSCVRVMSFDNSTAHAGCSVGEAQRFMSLLLDVLLVGMFASAWA